MTDDFLNNFRSIDPFTNASAQSALNIGNGEKMDQHSSNVVHIRIQQRNRGKSVTTIQGIDEKFDKNKLLQEFARKFACGGNIVKHKEYGEVIQLQGDKRNGVNQFLIDNKMYSDGQIKVHGF
ncbi:unnamed protein product [Adineta steineri]|uniref:SUI1 domain-containing protein n=1 Tax=Adineta steineri TaxID=433720 RepID=A0A814PC60_9BILA|nr:unnamed protein product [Adineta steineri]CAF1102704.1 unnamed protein product [Adineta steineri]